MYRYFILFVLIGTQLHAQPNVVMILADDVGWADWQYDAQLNPTGSKLYETPNIIELAQRSVIFRDAYAAQSVCSPTRASVLTGQSPARTRVTNFTPGNPNTTANLREPYNWLRYLPTSTVTIADTLKSAGYTNGFFGKWHMGSGNTDPTSDPKQYGFDVNVAGNHFGYPESYFAGSDGMWAGVPGLDTPGTYPVDAYLTDVMDGFMSDFIEQNAGGPFFLANWNFASHIPLQAPPELIAKYQSKIAALQSQGVDLNGQHNAAYAALMEKLDDSVGVMLRRLDDPNNDGDTSDSIRDNTLVIFTSDNGGDSASSEGYPTGNLPLREGKGSSYEGGTRVPMMISTPGMMSHSFSDAPTASYDLYPTIVELTGAGSTPITAFDGVSLAPAINGQPFDRGPLIWHYPHRSNSDAWSPEMIGGAFTSSIVDGDWKLIFFYDDRHYELYNLVADGGETTNLLQFNPQIAHDLSLQLHDYLVGVNAQMPVLITTGVPVAPPMVLQQPILGDYNGDTVVNAADYAAWRTELGSTTHLAADGNRNGVIDTADYIIWRKAILGLGLQAVPEPTTVLLVIVAVCFLSMWRRS